MMRILALTLAVLIAAPAAAAERAAVDALSRTMALPDFVEIMRREGLQSADDLATDMAGGGGPRWNEALERIYDTGRMQATVLDRLAAELDDDEVRRIDAFFRTELGTRIIRLELSAREAMLDEGIEEASNEAALALPETDPERFDRIEEFIAVNNLIESNVVGAMNSNFAFFTGLVEGGFFDDAPAEDEMLNQVWSQEPEIRRETVLWLHSFSGLAYRPLSDDDLRIYIDFSATEAGQAMNRALFAGFDRMFTDISRALGLTLGRMGRAEEL